MLGSGRLSLLSLVAALAALFSHPLSADELTVCTFSDCEVLEELGGSQHGFAPNDAFDRKTMTQLVAKITAVNGLRPNFEIVATEQVPNAAAVIQSGQRLLLYNPIWVEQLNSGGDRSARWKLLGLLAHEIGHHFQGHTLDDLGSRPTTELEADEYAGYILSALGATQEQAVLLWATLPAQGSHTHPPRDQRLAAVQAGWAAWRQMVSRSGGAQPSTTASLPGPKNCPGALHPHRVRGIADNDVLNMRQGPSSKTGIVGIIPPNAGGIDVKTCRAVAGYSKAWCKVSYDCKDGWVYSRYLQPEGVATASRTAPLEELYRIRGIESWDVLNVRSGPSTEAAVLGSIPPDGSGIAVGRCRVVSGYRFRWCQVSWQGLEGWASAGFLASMTTGRRP